jgi:hypothetical protein
METTQVVLKLSRSRVGPGIVTEIDAVAAKEVFVPDLVDVFSGQQSM